MIFASVGSMLPFDRFVKGIDDWAEQNSDQDVFIQIGDGAYEPVHAPWVRIMPHSQYRRRLQECTLFVAHVGMGSILQALEMRKQMLLLPRHAEWREHTTDHQIHTAERFKDTKGLLIVDGIPALHVAMSRLIVNPLEASDGIPPYAPDAMIQKVADFLNASIKSPGKR